MLVFFIMLPAFISKPAINFGRGKAHPCCDLFLLFFGRIWNFAVIFIQILNLFLGKIRDAPYSKCGEQFRVLRREETCYTFINPAIWDTIRLKQTLILNPFMSCHVLALIQ